MNAGKELLNERISSLEKVEKAKIVFMGTPEFAAASLEYLASRYEIQLVLSQPDRPKGRGKKLLPSEVKAKALALGIPVETPGNLKEEKELVRKLQELEPDFFVVVAFGQILSKKVLAIPKLGSINLHASLLPAYRGAAPIQAAILHGEKVTGNTTMLMDEELDTGDILLKQEMPIPDKMTFGQLHDQLMDKGKVLLNETLEGMLAKKITPQKQPDQGVSYVPKFKKSLARLDFQKSGEDLVNLIRAMNPAPLAFAILPDGQHLKIHEATFTPAASDKKPGTILSQSKNGIEVAVQDGILNLTVLQMPGKRAMSAQDFLNGRKLDFPEFLAQDQE